MLVQRTDPAALQASSADPGDVQVSLMKDSQQLRLAMLSWSLGMHLKS